MTLPYECFITIGDWSEDGHNHYDVFSYQASHPIPEQQKAYLKSVKKTGVAFDHTNANGPYAMCVEWKSNVISPFHIELLRRHAGIDQSKAGDCGPGGFFATPEDMPPLILWFIGVSIPGFQFEDIRQIKVKEKVVEKGEVPYYSPSAWLERSQGKILNGWWGKLNHQFGYGCYGPTCSLLRR